jgi:hypothetical protein
LTSIVGHRSTSNINVVLQIVISHRQAWTVTVGTLQFDSEQCSI